MHIRLPYIIRKAEFFAYHLKLYYLKSHETILFLRNETIVNTMCTTHFTEQHKLALTDTTKKAK